MRVLTVVLATIGVVAGALAGCGPEEVTLPTPPMAAETARLAALYDMPTAVLDQASAEQLIAAAEARLGDLHTDWLPDVVVDALARLRRRLDAGGLPTDPGVLPARDRTQQTVVAQVHRVCAGWDSSAGGPDEATNGALDVTAIVDRGRLNPEVWGSAASCRVRLVVRATLDGTLIVYLLGPVPSTPAEAQLLVTFNGTIAVSDGAPKSIAFDFEVVNRTIRFRVPAGGGDAIVTVGATLGVKGANAGFSCDVAARSCRPT